LRIIVSLHFIQE